MKEVGDAGIVAIAVHNLVTEVSGVVAQLVLDVGTLGVELVVLLLAWLFASSHSETWVCSRITLIIGD